MSFITNAADIPLFTAILQVVCVNTKYTERENKKGAFFTSDNLCLHWPIAFQIFFLGRELFLLLILCS